MPYKDKSKTSQRAQEWDRAHPEQARARKRKWWVMRKGHGGTRGRGKNVFIGRDKMR
jgi:hypothetical protein